MGYYTKEPAVSGGVGNQKSRVEVFSADTSRKSPSRSHDSPVREGFRAVGNDTCTVGVRLFGYRYYNPELGRWPNIDPIEDTGGLPRDRPMICLPVEITVPLCPCRGYLGTLQRHQAITLDYGR